MSGNNEARFTLTLAEDSSAVGALFSAFKKQVRSDVAEIEKVTRDVKLFSTLDAELKKAAQAVDDTRNRLAKLRDMEREVQAAGESIGKDLAAGLAQASRAAAAAEKDLLKQSVTVDKLRTSLKAANVDVTNLAAAEAKLAAETRRAAAAQVEQDAKLATGFKTLKDVQPEVNRVIAAYNSLASSGRLTFGELGTLQAKTQQQLTALQSGVTGVGGAFREVRGSILGFAAAFAGVIAAGSQSATNFREFNTQIQAIGTIAGVSEEELAALGTGVRKLAREMGTEAVNSAQALYDIIGSGIPVDNSLQVLALASKAARAGLTDVHTAASVGVAILNGYGLQVDKLEHVYNVLFQTVKDGVITFPELAANIGDVIPIAQKAYVPLEQLGAAFVVLTRQGIKAPEAATIIARSIQALASPAPEAAARMRELNIVFDGLVGTVEQFAKKNLSLEQLNALIPDVRAARGVLALSQNFRLLEVSTKAAAESAGSMEAAYKRMAATPQAQVDRFNSAVNDLSISVGEFVTGTGGFVEALTVILNAFNGLGEKTKATVIQFVALTGAVIALSVAFRTLAGPLNLLVGSLLAARTAVVTLTGSMTAATLAASAFKLAIAFFAGFKLGEIMYEQSEAVRFFGDMLGTTLGAVKLLTDFVGGVFVSVFTLSLQPLKDAGAQFLRNAKIIGGDYYNAVTGATEGSRMAAQRQRELGETLAKTAKAAAEAATQVGASVATLLTKLEAQSTASKAAIESTQAVLTSLVASLNKSVDDITSTASAELATVAARTAQQLAALASTDVQKIRDTVAIQRQAAVDRMLIIQQFAQNVTAAFESSAASQRAIAVKSGLDLVRVDQDIAQQRVKTSQSIVDRYRAEVSELLGLARGHLENIRQIEEQRRAINQSVEDKIRDIRRGGMTAYEQYNDKIREIDKLTSQARGELAKGDQANYKLVEELSKKAIDVAGSIATEVKDGERVVVSASTAQSTAIGKITTAQNILNTSLGARETAERAGAQAAEDGLKKTLPLLQQYEKDLASITAKAKEGVTVRIKADVTAVNTAVEDLANKLLENAITVKLIADLKAANDAVAELRGDLAKGVPVQFVARTEALKVAIENVKQANPELTVQTDAALGKVDALRKEAEKLSTLTPVINATVKSNVGDVQAEINNLKKPTESTHTVRIKEVREGSTGSSSGSSSAPTPGFRRGGLVGAVQRFAAGGGVGSLFRRPTWNRVPGSGNQDTVPALLREGQFVVKKSASAHYGSGLMSALAGVRRFAGGGQVTKDEAQQWAKTIDAKGFKTGDSFQSGDAPVNFDSRPVPEIFLVARYVLAYAREMLNSVGANNPLLGSLKPAIIGGISAVERNPGDSSAIKKLLQAAETIGANPYIFGLWEKTTGGGDRTTPIWYIDWLAKQGLDPSGAKGKSLPLETTEFAKRFFNLAGKRAGPSLINLERFFKFAAGGNTGTDTVPALLTPGEYVVNRKAVRHFGSNFMHAINNMMVPRSRLASMLAAPPSIARFATGGQVGAMPAPSPAAAPRAVQSITANFYLDASDLLSETNVRKKVVPVLNEMLRRST